MGAYIVRYRENSNTSMLRTMSISSMGSIRADRVIFKGTQVVPEVFGLRTQGISTASWPSIGLFRDRPNWEIQRLTNHPDVVSVEEDCLISLAKIPNDKNWSQQWAMPYIQAPTAWDQTTGSRSVIAAVIDTGIDHTHPDLKNNMWTNLSEKNGRLGVDDDNNGYIDDIYGYDFVDNSGKTTPGNKPDDAHGTHVSGIIGASGNNSVGVAGISWQVRLMAVRILKANPRVQSNSDPLMVGSTSGYISGVYYAVENRAQVLNLSIGQIQPYSPAEQQAFAYSISKNVLPVVAAGNNASDARMATPAAIPGAFAVGATDGTNDLANFSNFGDRIDIVAPGTAIYSTVPNGKYDYMSGTSMAAPLVTGTAALLLSIQPNYSPRELAQVLTQSATSIVVSTSLDSEKNQRKAYPFLNVAAAVALAKASQAPNPTASTPTPAPIEPSQDVPDVGDANNGSLSLPSVGPQNANEPKMAGCGRIQVTDGPLSKSHNPVHWFLLTLPLFAMGTLRFLRSRTGEWN